MANPYSTPITDTYKYKPLDISTLAQPMAMAQQQYDAQVQAVDAAVFELQGLSPDSQRAKDIKEYLNAGAEDIANKLMTSKDFRTAGRNLARLNKFYTTDEELSAIRSNYDSWTKAVERERKRVKKGDITQEAFDGWYSRKMQEFEDKGGTSYDDGNYNTIDVSGREINRAKELDEYALKLMQAKPSDRKTMLGHLKHTMSVGDKAIFSRLTEKHEYVDENELRNDIYKLISSSDRFRPWLQEKADYQYYFDSRNNPQFAAEKYGEWNAALDMQEKELEDEKAKLEKEGKYNKNAKARYAELKNNIKEERKELVDGYAKSKGNYIKQEYLKGVQDNYYMNLASGLGDLGSFDKKDYSVKDITVDGNSGTNAVRKELNKNLSESIIGSGFAVSNPIIGLEENYDNMAALNSSTESNKYVLALNDSMTDQVREMNDAQKLYNEKLASIEETYGKYGDDIPKELEADYDRDMAEVGALQTNYDNARMKYAHSTKNLKDIVNKTSVGLRKGSGFGRKIGTELIRIENQQNKKLQDNLKRYIEDNNTSGMTDEEFMKTPEYLQVQEDLGEVYSTRALQLEINLLSEMEAFGKTSETAKASMDIVQNNLSDYVLAGGDDIEGSKGRGHRARKSANQYLIKRGNKHGIKMKDIGGTKFTTNQQIEAIEGFLNFDIVKNKDTEYGRAPRKKPTPYYKGKKYDGVDGNNWTTDLMSVEDAEKHLADIEKLKQAKDEEGLKAKLKEIKEQVQEEITSDYKDANDIYNDYKIFENAAARIYEGLDKVQQVIKVPNLLVTSSTLKDGNKGAALVELDEILRRNAGSKEAQILTMSTDGTEYEAIPDNVPLNLSGFTFSGLTRTKSNGQPVALYDVEDGDLESLSDSQLYNLFMVNEGKETGPDGQVDYPKFVDMPETFNDLLNNKSKGFSAYGFGIFEKEGPKDARIKTDKLTERFRQEIIANLTDAIGRGAQLAVSIGETNINTTSKILAHDNKAFILNANAFSEGNDEAFEYAQRALINLANDISVLETPKTSIPTLNPDGTALTKEAWDTYYGEPEEGEEPKEKTRYSTTMNDHYAKVASDLVSGRRGRYQEESWNPVTNQFEGILYSVKDGELGYKEYRRDEDGNYQGGMGEWKALNMVSSGTGMTATASMIYNNLFYIEGYKEYLKR